MWIPLGIFSSVLLGFHEIFKKVSLNPNAVLPVLLLGSEASALVSALIIVRRASAVLVFAAGAMYFKETSLRKRGIVLAGILAGVAIVVVGSI